MPKKNKKSAKKATELTVNRELLERWANEAPAWMVQELIDVFSSALRRKELAGKQPMQPLELVDGVVRFKRNRIVDYLANGRMNELAALNMFPREDWEQFAQLIGYSVSGFGDLSYAGNEVVQMADKLAAELTETARRKEED